MVKMLPSSGRRKPSRNVCILGRGLLIVWLTEKGGVLLAWLFSMLFLLIIITSLSWFVVADLKIADKLWLLTRCLCKT